MDVCSWRLERARDPRVTAAGDLEVIVWVRFICACGKATHWYRDEHRGSSSGDQLEVADQLALL